MTDDNDIDTTGSLDEVTEERYRARLINGAAMDEDALAIDHHWIAENDSAESGSQGNTLGRENQNPVGAAPSQHAETATKPQQKPIGSGQ